MIRHLCLLISTLLFFYCNAQTITGVRSLCEGTSTLLTVNGTDVGSTYQWQYAIANNGPWANADGNSTAQDYSATKKGFYRVIVNPGNKISTNVFEVVESSKPDASFTFTPSAQCSDQPVNFISISTPGALYNWIFDDPNSGNANSSPLNDPVHTFIGTTGNGTQSFSVMLSITSKDGCINTSTKTVTTKQLPDVTLGGTGAKTYNGKNYFTVCGSNLSSATFTFTNTSSTSSTNTNYKIIWGDGAPDYTNASFVSQTHLYAVGNYTLSFIVTGADGCINTGTYYVFVGSNPAVGLGNPGNTEICTGGSLTFPIHETETNPPQTTYMVTVNDGTLPVFFQHPPPSDVSHIFNFTSCGTTSDIYTNSFSISIQASNPCKSSSATVVPIYVSEKSVPVISVTPKDTVCTNNNITVTNSGIKGQYIPDGQCIDGKSVWTIFPSTGYAIVSGSLGNDFGSQDPTVWLDGSQVLELKFILPGIYTIKLKAGNGNTKCGADSVTKTICVSSTPTASFTTSLNAGCAPFVVKASNTSNHPECGKNRYNWNVVKTNSSDCDIIQPEYQYINSTDENSENPQLQFNSPGTYTISLVNTFDPSGCSSTVATETITVKGKPKVVLNEIFSVCENESIKPTASYSCSVDGLSTYTWSFPGGSPVSSPDPIPGTVTYSTPGNYTIGLEVTNSCGITTATKNFAVNPLPALTVPAAAAYCAETTAGPFIFSSNPAGAVTWTNDNTNIGLGNSGSGDIPAFTAINNTGAAIAATITVQTTAGGCVAVKTFTVTVYPKLNPPAVTTPVSYCKGEVAQPLTAIADAGNTLLWYTTATGGTGSATAPVPGTTTIGSTLYYVSQISSATNCESGRASIEIIINSIPAFTATFINPTACGTANGSITLTGLAVNTNYKVDYTQDGTGVTANITADSGGELIINGLASGLYSHIRVTANNCSSAEAGPFTLTNPNPPATPVLNKIDPVCSGGTINLSATTTTPGTATWSWTGPNGFSSTAQNPAITNVPVADSGTYYAIVKINNCTSEAGSTNVIINSTPATPVIVSNTPVCTGNTLSFTNTPDGAGVTYAWTGPNSFTSALQNPFINNVTAAATGVYTVQATLGACSSTANAAVVVNETPVITEVVPVNPSQCASATGSLTLKGLSGAKTYTISYTRNGVFTTESIIADGNGNVIISNLSAATYNDIQVTLNDCSSGKKGPFSLNDPNPPDAPTISSNTPLCAGNQLVLFSSNIPTGAVYLWTGPAGFTSNAKSPTIENITVVNAGTYSLAVQVNGCLSPAANTAVIINPTPEVIANNTLPVCSGQTITLTASTTFTGQLTWLWSGPAGFTSAQQNPVITNAPTAASGTYTVTATATTGNCPSLASTAAVIVAPTPVISSSDKINPSACATATGAIILHTSLSNTFYTIHYTYQGNAVEITRSSDTNGDIHINNLTAGLYEHLYIVAGNCPSSETSAITLADPNPPAAPTINSNAPVCLGATLQLQASTTAAGTVTYQWSGPNSFSSNLQNPLIENMTASNGGTYTVTATVNNCTSAGGEINVVVNPLGKIPAATTPVMYCKDVAAMPLFAVADAGNTLNWYTEATGGISTSTAPIPATATTGTVSYYVSQTTAAGCEGARAPIEVITNPDAKALFAPAAVKGCAPFLIDENVVNLQLFPDNNAAYEWYANGVLIGSGAAFPPYTIQKDNDSVLIKLKTISKFDCKDDSMSIRFYTYQLPQTAFVADKTTDCGPSVITFTNQTPEAEKFQFKWDFGNGQMADEANPAPVTFATNPEYGDTNYHVVLMAYTVCDTIKAFKDILIKSKPKALFTPDKSSGCSPMTVHFTNISKGLGVNYEWIFDDGQSSTGTEAGTIEHQYITGVQDTFYAKLVATNECGTDTAQYAIVVSPNKIRLDFAINGNQTTGCAPHTVQFINNSSGATNFQWNFGDGNMLNTTKNVDTVSHTFIISGQDTITLFASNGCSDTTSTEIITVFDKPTVAFNATPVSACIGDSVLFTNESVNYTSLLWNFGDGRSSVLTNPIHAYQKDSAYHIILIAVKQYANGAVCSDSAVKSINIVSKLPGAFTADQTVSTCAPFTVTFTNTTLPSALTAWSFGDGTVDTGDVVTHTFITPATYNVVMQAHHPAGCLYEASKQIVVNGPKGTIAYGHGFVCGNTPVRFEASTSGADSVRWDFGDGQFETTTESIIYHQYLRSGIFVPAAALIAGNGGSCRVPVITGDTIKVDYISAGYAIVQDVLCGSTTIQFNDTSHAYFGLQSWQWNLGDGTVAAVQNPIHTYTATSSYPVQLIAVSNSGCADTMSNPLPVKVNNLPVAAIDGATNTCDLQAIPYKARVISVDSVSFYKWTITGDAVYNTSSIMHTFLSAGSYNMQLVAGTLYGCYDTANVVILVKTTPIVIAGPDVTICKGAATTLSVNSNAPFTWQTEPSLSCTTCSNPTATPVQTVQYFVTGTNADGCSRTDSVIVTVIQPLVLTVSADDSICINQTKQLIASGAAHYVWTPAETLNNPTSQNPVASPTVSTIYTVIGNDNFHCFSDTQQVIVGVGKYPTISLGADVTLPTGTMLPLKSEVTEGPIKSYVWSPAANLNCTNCALPEATIKKAVCYTVNATTYYGCSAADTLCIKVFCEKGQLFIPNVFTPDGDGINDKLIIQGKGINIIKSFRIFNRWGQVVFERANFQANDPSFAWDGKVKGVQATPDVYVYTCEILCEDNTPFTYKGNVAIIK